MFAQKNKLIDYKSNRLICCCNWLQRCWNKDKEKKLKFKKEKVKMVNRENGVRIGAAIVTLVIEILYFFIIIGNQ